jgi:hypothetical protein
MYLGPVLDDGNKMWTFIPSDITTANRVHSAHKKLVWSKLVLKYNIKNL